MNLVFTRTLGMRQAFDYSLVNSIEKFKSKSWVWGVDVYENGKLPVLLTELKKRTDCCWEHCISRFTDITWGQDFE